MSDLDIATDRINVFRVGEEYLLKYYFDREYLFDELESYYTYESYRFEVPLSEFDSVRELLEAEYFDPVVITDIEPYCVVKEAYTKHADILRNSVLHWERNAHNFFLLKDDLSVREAIELGADPVEDTEFVVGL